MNHSPIILIADDHLGAREVLQGILLPLDYQLHFAENGREALSKAIALKPDLILLDVMMPGITGINICKILRDTPGLENTPIILITALDDPGTLVKGLQVGANDFITKPYNYLELQARIKNMLRFNLQQQLNLKALQTERDNTHAILQAVGEAVVVCDMEGVIQYLNPVAVKLSGFHVEEMLYQDWDIWLPDKTSSCFYSEIALAVKAGETWCGQVALKHKNGSTYNVHLIAAPIFLPHNSKTPTGWVATFQDITLLQNSDSLKNRLVSSISHELLTPLSVITLISDNLNNLYYRLSDDKRQKMIQDIQRHLQTVNTLIDSLQNISDEKKIPVGNKVEVRAG